MLLLTIKEWLGIKDTESHYYKTEYEKTKGFVTNLRLPEAINILTQYKEQYCRTFPDSRLTFSLVSVSEIEELTQDQIDNMRLQLIEYLLDSEIFEVDSLE